MGQDALKKAHIAALRKAWRHTPKGRAYIRAQGARQAAMPENKRKRPAQVASWKRRNRGKMLAHLAVYYALKVGKLTKPGACSRCSTPASGRKLQAHHADYSKKLDVEWLCHECHVLRHWYQPESSTKAANAPGAALETNTPMPPPFKDGCAAVYASRKLG